jgi:hypothetical protein
MEEKRKRAEAKGKLKRRVIYVYEDEDGKEYREEGEEEDYNPYEEQKNTIMPESKRMKSEGRLVSRQYVNLYEDSYKS